MLLRCCGTKALPLPDHLYARIDTLARSPAPSANALRQHFDDHPWLSEVREALPEMKVSNAILNAPRMGLMDCWKCGRCDYAAMYRIRCRYHPQLLTYWDDPPDDAYDRVGLEELQRTLRMGG